VPEQLLAPAFLADARSRCSPDLRFDVQKISLGLPTDRRVPLEKPIMDGVAHTSILTPRTATLKREFGTTIDCSAEVTQQATCRGEGTCLPNRQTQAHRLACAHDLSNCSLPFLLPSLRTHTAYDSEVGIPRSTTHEQEGLMDPTTTATRSGARINAPEPHFSSFAGLARHITVAGFSGLVAGVLVGGIGSRIFMRIAGAIASDAQRRTTEAGFRVGEVTFGGTVALIIFVGIFSGLVVAVYYIMLFPWLSWLGRWRGVGFGLVGFAAASATSDLMNPDNIDFFILKNEPVLVGMIFILFVAFGVVTDGAYRFIDRGMPTPDRNVNAVFYTFTGLGLVTGVPLAIGTLTGEGCDCPVPIGVVWSLALLAAATVAWWISVLAARSPTWIGRSSTVAGYLGTAGVLTFGLIRAISDAADIIR